MVLLVSIIPSETKVTLQLLMDPLLVNMLIEQTKMKRNKKVIDSEVAYMEE